jgi:microcystin-dependent protein
MTKFIRAHNEPENGPRPKDQLPHARLHDLRHLHATTLLLSGVPVHVVAARLGHADPAITLRVYAHVIRAAEAAAADIFAQAVNTPQPTAAHHPGTVHSAAAGRAVSKGVSKNAPSMIGRGR